MKNQKAQSLLYSVAKILVTCGLFITTALASEPTTQNIRLIATDVSDSMNFPCGSDQIIANAGNQEKRSRLIYLNNKNIAFIGNEIVINCSRTGKYAILLEKPSTATKTTKNNNYKLAILEINTFKKYYLGTFDRIFTSFSPDEKTIIVGGNRLRPGEAILPINILTLPTDITKKISDFPTIKWLSSDSQFIISTTPEDNTPNISNLILVDLKNLQVKPNEFSKVEFFTSMQTTPRGSNFDIENNNSSIIIATRLNTNLKSQVIQCTTLKMKQPFLNNCKILFDTENINESLGFNEISFGYNNDSILFTTSSKTSIIPNCSIMQYRTSKNAINCAVYLPFYPYHGLQNSILDKKWGFIVSKLETRPGTTEQFNLYLYPDTEK